jgi:lipopolysaccharide export system permease protein
VNTFSRYLFREILPLYVAGLAVLLVLLLMSFLLGVLADVLARGVPIAMLARFLLFKLPAAAGPGLPLALLFAALLGLTRLGQDGEIKAALLLGVSPRRFLMPMLGLGLLVSLLAFANDELVVPWSEQRALQVQKDILLRSPETVVKAGTFFTDALGRDIYIGAVKPGGHLENVTVISPGGPLGPREVIQAASGDLDQAAGVWRLHDLRFRVFRSSRQVLDVHAASGSLPVRGLAVANAGAPDLVYLPPGQLLKRLREAHGRPEPAAWTALQRKLAGPLAATAFALFALAVALFTFRRGASLGFVSVLLLTFIYYATSSVSKLLGEQGTVPAYVAGWAPVGLYALAGGTLLALSWRR